MATHRDGGRGLGRGVLAQQIFEGLLPHGLHEVRIAGGRRAEAGGPGIETSGGEGSRRGLGSVLGGGRLLGLVGQPGDGLGNRPPGLADWFGDLQHVPGGRYSESSGRILLLGQEFSMCQKLGSADMDEGIIWYRLVEPDFTFWRC